MVDDGEDLDMWIPDPVDERVRVNRQEKTTYSWCDLGSRCAGRDRMARVLGGEPDMRIGAD